MEQVAVIIHQQHSGVWRGAGIVAFERMDAEALAIVRQVHTHTRAGSHLRCGD